MEIVQAVEDLRQVARHIYYARACLLSGDTWLGCDPHLQDALNLLGVVEPSQVGLSNSILTRKPFAD